MHSAHIAKDHSEKRIQTCTDHSRAVAKLAKANLEDCELGATGYLAGLLHDCGKFTDEFDAYLEKAVNGEKVRKGEVIHTFTGVSYLLKQFHSRGGCFNPSDITAEILAASIGSHHGLMDIWDERHQNGFDVRQTRQPKYDQRAINDFHAECAEAEEIRQLFQKADAEVLKFYGEKLMHSVKTRTEANFASALLVRLITSAVVDADRTDTRCFMQNIPHPALQKPIWDACVNRVNAHVAAFPQITPIQKARRSFSDLCAAAAENKPGLYCLNLPTGGGKTLAALKYAALHAQTNGMRRIIYTAPLLSIIEQNAKEIRSAMGETASVLEHHSNILKDESNGEEITRMELLQENWDAQIIVTTFVQLLNTLFSGKMSSVRRFHCLCNSVIIIDEVQSLPPKMLSMFNIAVNFLVQSCGTTVLLCSATQPAFDKAIHQMLDREKLISEDVFQQYAPLFRRTVIEDKGYCSMSELVQQAVESVNAVNSLLIVCNTKREAAEMVQEIGQQTEAKVFHLSGGMCMAHREKTFEELKRALARKEKLICVSTQLIEAGVDVSFDRAIRLAAGLDNIVQTAGRCNRHGEHETPQSVYIYHLKDEKLGSLKEIQQAQDALTVLLEKFRRYPEQYSYDLTSDAAIREYYTALYRDMAKGAQDYRVHGQTLFNLLSQNTQFAPEHSSAYFLKQAFRTAGEWFEVFDTANESVLVPYGEGVKIIEQLTMPKAQYDLEYADKLLQSAKPYAVSLAENQIKRMAEQGMIYSLLDGRINILNKEYYDAQMGIKEGNDSCATLIL